MNKVTYNQLTKALITLGFEKVERSNFIAFPNSEYDAMIVLPKGTSETVVSPAHLLTVERTVSEKGIASSDKFSRMIIGMRRPHVARVMRMYATDGGMVTGGEHEAASRLRRKLRLRISPSKKVTKIK